MKRPKKHRSIDEDLEEALDLDPESLARQEALSEDEQALERELKSAVAPLPWWEALSQQEQALDRELEFALAPLPGLDRELEFAIAPLPGWEAQSALESVKRQEDVMQRALQAATAPVSRWKNLALEATEKLGEKIDRAMNAALEPSWRISESLAAVERAHAAALGSTQRLAEMLAEVERGKAALAPLALGRTLAEEQKSMRAALDPLMRPPADVEAFQSQRDFMGPRVRERDLLRGPAPKATNQAASAAQVREVREEVRELAAQLGELRRTIASLPNEVTLEAMLAGMDARLQRIELAVQLGVENTPATH